MDKRRKRNGNVAQRIPERQTTASTTTPTDKTCCVILVKLNIANFSYVI